MLVVVLPKRGRKRLKALTTESPPEEVRAVAEAVRVVRVVEGRKQKPKPRRR